MLPLSRATASFARIKGKLATVSVEVSPVGFVGAARGTAPTVTVHSIRSRVVVPVERFVHQETGTSIVPKLGQYQGVLDTVFFLYNSIAAAQEGKQSGGSGFLVGLPMKQWPNQYYHVYGVTNWHVACASGASVVRLNTIEGAQVIFDFGPDQWQFIPGDYDVAVIPLNIKETHKVRFLEPRFLITEEEIKTSEVGPGDDVFMVGRFVDYDGVQTNKPAIRFGHISMADVPIKQSNGCTKGSFVIDMHSRSGFSGSPVFVYRTLGSHFLEAAQPGQVLTGGGHSMWLLGIHWGQFPERWELTRAVAADTRSDASLITEGQYVAGLSGMTCVCPASAIKKALDMPVLQQLRAHTESEMEK